MNVGTPLPGCPRNPTAYRRTPRRGVPTSRTERSCTTGACGCWGGYDPPACDPVHVKWLPPGGSCRRRKAVTDEGTHLPGLGDFRFIRCGPLIRPFGPPSPQGEGISLSVTAAPCQLPQRGSQGGRVGHGCRDTPPGVSAFTGCLPTDTPEGCPYG